MNDVERYSWMKNCPPGWFKLEEAEIIAKTAKAVCQSVRPRQYVEIGTWAGRSAFMMAHLLGLDWEVATIDPYISYPDGFFNETDRAVTTTQSDTPAVIAERVLGPLTLQAEAHRLGCSRVVRYVDSSVAVAVRWALSLHQSNRPQVNVLLVDGWHAPEAVVEDAEHWLPNMGHEAVIFFHDANHWRFGEGVQTGIAMVRWPTGWVRVPSCEAGSLHCWASQAARRNLTEEGVIGVEP